MQDVSATTVERLAAWSRITLHCYIDENESTAPIKSCTYTAGNGTESAFAFGHAVSAGVTITLDGAIPDIDGKSIEITWQVDEDEYPLLFGRIETGRITAGQTTVTAWDELYWGGSGLYTGGIIAGEDAGQALAVIAQKIGIAAEQESIDLLSGIFLSHNLSNEGEISFAAAAGHLAGLVGGNAIITRTGELGIRQYTSTDQAAEVYSGGAVAENQDFAVTGITMQRYAPETVSYDTGDGITSQTEEYSAGDGSLMVINPLADQAAADRVYGMLSALSFRPGTYSIPGGLLLEPGDLLTIKTMDGDYTALVSATSLELDGGARCTITAGGYAESGGAQGSINQQLRILEADYARLGKIVADNAEIVSARISSLSADDITAGRIQSTDFLVSALPMVFPGAETYPAANLYPSNGEEIIRGMEIDFSSGIIRGSFWADNITKLEQQIATLEDKINLLVEQIKEIPNQPIYPVTVLRTLEED